MTDLCSSVRHSESYLKITAFFNHFFKELCMILVHSYYCRTLTQLIRVENNAKMDHVLLRVVSRANSDGRGHIKDKELVGALEQ